MFYHLQQMNNDAVLEVTETVMLKERFSQKDLLRQKAYFEELIAKATAGLARVQERLTQIDNERAKAI